MPTGFFAGSGTGEAAAAALLEGLLRACVGGGIFVIAVWCVCRLLPRLSAASRFWLWWLACAKMFIGLVCAASMTVQVALPMTAVTAPPPAVHAVLRHFAAPAPTVKPDEGAAEDEPTVSPVPIPVTAPAAAPTSQSPTLPTLPVLLASFWLVGAGGVLLTGLRASLPLRRLLRGAIPLTADENAERIARLVGLRHVPALRQSSDAPGPLVAGLWKPAVVLPEGFGDGLTSEEIRMALAHEMAHLRRGDLWLGLLPALTRALFFFFPLAHLACRECAACREEACDAAALAATGAAPAGYGQLLLKMVARQRGKVAPPALSMAAVHFRQLKRRLIAVQRAPGRLLRGLGIVCVSCGLAGILPWRVSAVLPKLEEAVRGETEPLPTYTLTDLGTLGGRYSDAYAISDSGNVVGSANVYPLGLRGHAFTWDGEKMRDLTNGSIYRHSVAFAVNEQGQIAATAFNRASRPYAFVWRNGKRQYLGALSANGIRESLRYSRAFDINGQGEVVGTAQASATRDGALPARAFLWKEGKMRDLGTLGGPYSHALAVSETGLVVGKADLSSGPTHAFLHDGAQMRDLGVLNGGNNSLANDINGQGQVVGFSEVGGGILHAFLYNNTEGMRDLGTLEGTEGSIAHAVNDQGTVVGSSYTGGPEEGVRRAVVWLPGKSGPRLRDLNELMPSGSGWVLECARGVNNAGQIVGQGIINGQRRAFLLTPQ
jgi:probable HAF family extracellular repeat protein